MRAPAFHADCRIVLATLATLFGLGFSLEVLAFGLHTETEGMAVMSTSAEPLCSISVTATAQPQTISLGSAATITISLDVMCPVLPRAQLLPADLAFVIDDSFSMDGEPLSIARAAAKRIINRLDPSSHRVAMIAYNHRATILSPFTTDYASVVTKIDSLTPTMGFASTSIYYALLELEKVVRGDERCGAPQMAIVIGDGEREERDDVSIATRLRSNGVQLLALGCGKKADDEHLIRVVGDESKYYPIREMAAVTATADAILSAPFIEPLRILTVTVPIPMDAVVLTDTISPGFILQSNAVIWQQEFETKRHMEWTLQVQPTRPESVELGEVRVQTQRMCETAPSLVKIPLPPIMVMSTPSPSPSASPTPTQTRPPTRSVATDEATSTSPPELTRTPSATAVKPTATVARLTRTPIFLPSARRRLSRP